MSDENLDRGDDVTDEALSTADAEAKAAADAKTAEDAKAAKAKEDADAEAAAGTKGEDKKDVQIPKARFDEAVKKERDATAKAEERAKAAEDKLAKQAEGVDAAKIEEEIGALEDKLDQAMLDNDVEKKKELRTQIRAKVQELAKSEAARQAAFATAIAVERVRYDAVLGALEAANPAINPDSDKFDEAVQAEVLELKTAYEAAGLGSTEALKKAAKYVFKTAPAEVKQEAYKGKTQEEKDKEAADAKATADAAAKAKEEAIKRGLEAKGKQPPADSDKAGRASDKTGAKHTAADVARMSDRDFNKLDEAELARARGDTL